MKNMLDALTGVNQEILERPECSSDRIKYRAIGLSMLSTSTLGFISGTFAIASFVPSLPIAISLGALWSFTITNLDRFLIINSGKKLVSGCIRLGLSLGSSVVISEPTNLFIFRSEIAREIPVMMAEQNARATATLRHGRLGEEEQRLSALIKELETKRESQVDAVMAEAEGRSPSGLAGKGTLYREKSAELGRTTQQIAQASKQLELKQAEIAREEAELSEKLVDSNSLLTRLQAMHHLRARNPTVNAVYWGITILLTGIEIAPLLAKLSGKPGVYETALETEEASAIRQLQLDARVIAERQRLTAEANATMQLAYNEKLVASMLKTLDETVVSDEFVALQKTLFERILRRFETHFGEALSIPIQEKVRKEKEQESSFQEKAQEVKEKITHLEQSLQHEPEQQQQQKKHSLFGGLLNLEEEDDEEDDPDPWDDIPTAFAHN